MRCLFTVLCVCALGLISVGGCGESAQCENDVCPCNEGGIRDAIAKGGGPYVFNCGPTTVATGSEIVIENDVVLDGQGNLTVDGNASHRVFLVARDTTAELRGVAITRGKTEFPGGGIYNEGSLTLTDSTVSGNSAGAGGGIANDEGPLTLTNTTVSGNSAETDGGGIFNYSGTVMLTSSAVSENTAFYGGGIYLFDSGTLTLTDSAVLDNSATAAGGGIHNHTWDPFSNGNIVTLTNSIVSGNTAVTEGGGINVAIAGALTLIDSAVLNNSATDATGRGGGISQGTGGVWGHAASLTLTNTTVSGNTARYGGGVLSAGPLTLVNSTVSGNTGFGGIYNWWKVMLLNSTVSGNVGTGIVNSGWETTLINTTVSANTHLGGGEGIFTGQASLTRVRNSLVTDGCRRAVSGTGMMSLGHNIESASDTCGFDQLTDQANVPDPMLGPLQNNGGPTETHALLDGSVAIDVIPEAECVDHDGEPLATDQRGEPRPAGDGCDVGAFEVQP
jgi:hypothetical protein